MKNLVLSGVFCLIACTAWCQSALKRPEAFLGYDLGERFVRHYEMLAYYRHVASVSPQVRLEQYGETYEKRPLVLATITAKENFSELEQIRTDNLKRAGFIEGKTSGKKIAIVWLSFNIHGNESSSLDASIKTLHHLADLDNKEAQAWLKNTVVILDPCINPDGRERYVNFYYSYGSRTPNVNGDAKEHHEPWPTGRPNHYLFDLNRDWAWQTQIETQQRIEKYHQWMPHVHVDYHEQWYNNPYYFAPAAEPFHEVITPWQHRFQHIIGKNHARYFDKNNWLYFTKESFDLFYPSYGDTYPMYNGAIGMTYEQGGHGFAGLGVELPEGDTLTLTDRVDHHFTTALSTIEIAAQYATQLVDNFDTYFKESRENPKAVYKTYVVKGNQPEKLKSLQLFLDRQKIDYGKTEGGRSYKAYDYGKNAESMVRLDKGDLIISMYQPKSKLIKVLFEPHSKLSDSLTYDITAWSIPYAYGLEAYALKEKLVPTKTKVVASMVPQPRANEGKPYAYIAPYRHWTDTKWLSTLLQKGVKVRFSELPFTYSGQRYEAGTLIIPRRYNETLGDNFDRYVLGTAESQYKEVVPASTGFMDSGIDFGSHKVHYLKAPKVALLMGKEVSSLAFGEVWHFFEQQLEYPITAIDHQDMSGVSLSDYDVFIIPSGSYTFFDVAKRKAFASWVQQGGKLILMGNALQSFVDQSGFALSRYASEKEKDIYKEKEDRIKKEKLLETYKDRLRKRISSTISGAIYKVKLDNSHPLAYGYPETYYSLKTGQKRYGYLRKGWNVGVIVDKSSKLSGFSGYRTAEKMAETLVFGVEEKGAGTIIYMVDNPLYRAFWENGKLLMSNAVFMVGQPLVGR